MPDLEAVGLWLWGVALLAAFVSVAERAGRRMARRWPRCGRWVARFEDEVVTCRRRRRHPGSHLGRASGRARWRRQPDGSVAMAGFVLNGRSKVDLPPLTARVQFLAPDDDDA